MLTVLSIAPAHRTQEQVARLVEAQDARLSQVEAEAGEKAREARRHQVELQAKLDAVKDTCEGEVAPTRRIFTVHLCVLCSTMCILASQVCCTVACLISILMHKEAGVLER